AEDYGIHPALLDAALHPLGVLADAESHTVRLPFAWAGVTLHAAGADRVRVALTTSGGDGEPVAVTVADGTGRPVLTASSLTLRPIDPERLPSASAHGDRLFQVAWQPVAAESARETVAEEGWATLGSDPLALAAELQYADVTVSAYPDLTAFTAVLDAGVPAPPVVLLSCADAAAADRGAGAGADVPVTEDVHTAVHGVLETLRAWLADPRLSASRLVVVTSRAVATRAGEDVADLTHAPLWGLVRTAQTENPDRFLLVDAGDTTAWDGELLVDAVSAALAAGEPQVALREGQALVPKIVKAPALTTAAGPDEKAVAWRGEGTVLVTGGTGTLGMLVARHLAGEHGVRRLVLTSRSGAAAPGAEALVADLARLGAEAEILSCDVADQGELAALLGKISAEHPLTAVVHTAGVVEDGVLSALTREQVDAVLRPKVDAALNLHRLTRDLDLSAFVLFSSTAGVFGGPGQANYAAGNAFLDALAHHRRAQGLPATSIAWGLWEAASGMTGGLGGADLDRIARAGLAPLPSPAALALLDMAAGTPEEALFVAVEISRSRLRENIRAGTLPALLSGFAPATPRRASAHSGGDADAPSLARQLAGKNAEERLAFFQELVRSHVTEVLAHGSGTLAFDADRDFADLGFDSLTAVELRNRLGGVTGLRLPATLVFDYPNPRALAAYLNSQIQPDTDELPAVFEELQRLETALTAATVDADSRSGILKRLRSLVWKLEDLEDTASGDTAPDRGGDADDGGQGPASSLETATDDEMFDLINKELGLG
ncbi:type I polyketide synthase, partial [Streptomyces sp. NPDC093991]